MENTELPPSPEVERRRAKQREADRRFWSDPEKRTRANAAARARRATPEYRAQRRQKYASTPESRARQREKNRCRRAEFGPIKENPTVKADRQARNRAMRRGARAEKVDRSVVWERDLGACYICGQQADSAAWDLDHVVPVAKGGLHSYANVRVSHPLCNRQKYDSDPRDPTSRYAYLLEVAGLA